MEDRKIPLVALLEVEGKTLPVKNWSENGCTLDSIPKELEEKRWNVGNFIVPFEGFDLIIKEVRIELEKSNSGLNCKFQHLSPEQRNTLKAIIELYYRGDIFSLENLFNAIKKGKINFKKTESKRNNFLLPFVLGLTSGITIAYLLLKLL